LEGLGDLSFKNRIHFLGAIQHTPQKNNLGQMVHRRVQDKHNAVEKQQKREPGLNNREKGTVG